MKMTLSSASNSNTSSERPTNHSDQKSLSPSSSPRSSPRPSPRPESKSDHNKSDPFLSVNFKEQSGSGKHDGSQSSHESSVSGCVSSTDQTPPSEQKPESVPSTKERKEGRKKKSWFNSLYPTYKSRSEDFKRIFKEVPDDERLVVDYSCALQKEILVHGRLYVSQNYLCFYANIFGWETNVTLKWKDVTSISKEKTALVIPNAVLISTRGDQKYFFTTLATRDKTYVMLFRVWQNALMYQPMTAAELWQSVHQSYGDELGLTSDDEDYIAPGTEEDKLSVRSVESFSETEGGVTESNSNQQTMEDTEEKASTVADANKLNSNSNIPNASDADTESEIDKPIKFITTTKPLPVKKSPSSKPKTIQSFLKLKKPEPQVKCTTSHAGRQLVHQNLPIHIDELFTLLFTSSKFYLDFHATRKTTDLTQTPWTHNPMDNSKSRVVSQTISLSNTMGPKTAQVTETQMMLPCSKAGYLYSIDIETVNAGVPYADSFVVHIHYCLRRISDTQSSMLVVAQITYKKHVWGLVKGMIEKNCWSGLDDFFGAMVKALYVEAGDMPEKRKAKRRKRTHSTPKIVEKSRTTNLKIEQSKLKSTAIIEGGGAPKKSMSRLSLEESVGSESSLFVIKEEPEPTDAKDDNQKSTTFLIGGVQRKSASGASVSRDFPKPIPGRKKLPTSGLYNSNTVTLIVFVVLMVLVFLNVMLYIKLWSLEETPPYTVDLHILQNLPKSHEQWIDLLQKQESLHTVEVKKWQSILKNAVNLLRQAEESLMELQLSIHPSTNKFANMMQNENNNGINKDNNGEF